MGPNSGLQVQTPLSPDDQPFLRPGQQWRLLGAGGRVVGWAGALAPAVRRAFDLDAPVVVGSWNLADTDLTPTPVRYEPFSRYPAAKRDLSLVVGVGLDHTVGTDHALKVDLRGDRFSHLVQRVTKIGEQEVVVDHEQVGGGRLPAGLVVEALLEEGAPRAQGLVVVAGHEIPGVLVDRERQVPPRALGRGARPLGDAGERGARGREARRESAQLDGEQPGVLEVIVLHRAGGRLDEFIA